jgi:hypothetical protein
MTGIQRDGSYSSSLHCCHQNRNNMVLSQPPLLMGEMAPRRMINLLAPRPMESRSIRRDELLLILEKALGLVRDGVDELRNAPPDVAQWIVPWRKESNIRDSNRSDPKKLLCGRLGVQQQARRLARYV